MPRGARGAPPAPQGGLGGHRLDRGPQSPLHSRVALIAEGLNELGPQLGFRCAEGFAERMVYREFFPCGLTALDTIDESTLGTRPNMSHVTAREEVQRLLAALKLPIDEKGRRRAAARSEWFASLDKPLEIHDLLE